MHRSCGVRDSLQKQSPASPESYDRRDADPTVSSPNGLGSELAFESREPGEAGVLDEADVAVAIDDRQRVVFVVVEVEHIQQRGPQ